MDHIVRKRFDPRGEADPVWVVYRLLGDDPSQVVGVWTTEEKAQAQADALNGEGN